jgi:hypothetical protein
MRDQERLEAVGSRGEACIIVRSTVELPNGTTQDTYALATGERLRHGDPPVEFETLDGKRQFRLRN